MAEDEKPNTTDSDPPSDFRRAEASAPGASLTNEAAASPAGGAPNAADAIRDIGEAIAARRWAAPCSALEEIAQRLSRQEAAWRQAVASIMAPPVFPHETVARLQRLREPPVILPAVAKITQGARAILGGDEIARRIGGSQGALMAEMTGCLSLPMMPAGKPRPELQMSSAIERAYRKAAEEHRRMTEWLRSSSFEREMAAVANTTRLLKEVVESSMPRWLEATSAVSSLQDLATQVMTGRPPWPGAYESGPSMLTASDARGPENDASSAPLEEGPSPIVMPARPSWRAHPGRRRSYARAIERRDQREERALAGILSAEQWELLEQIARARGCSVAVLFQGVLGILAGVPAPEAQHRIWAQGFDTTPAQDAEAPDETSNRVLIRDSGGVFEVSYRGKSGQFRKLKGLHMLKHLIDNPGTRFGAYELWAFAGGAGEREERTASQDMAPGRTSDFGPMEVLDRQALKELKDRLDEIKEELSDARGDNDQARIKVLTEEREGILGQLPLKMGGKASRKEHSKLEQRARTNVGNLVAYALRVIKRNMPKAEAEIRVHLKMGYHCSYGGPRV